MQTYTLQYPITVDGQTLSEITIRRPKVGDIKRMDKQTGTQFSKVMWLLCQLAELSPAALDELDVADLAGLTPIIEGFLEGAAPTP
jgi:hypothetical protein